MSDDTWNWKSEAKREPIVDFSDGQYKFGFYGKQVRTAIYEKTKKMEEAASDLCDTVAREVGVDATQITALLVSLFSDEQSVKTRYIRSLCERTSDLYEEINALSRIGKGLNDDMVYLLGEEELKRFGL